MKLSRRSFMKANAVAAAAAAAGLSVPGVARAVVGQQEAIKWDKAPCRFCGTGCGVLVGTQQGRVVACQGDPDAPVNRGLNCIKGYFLPKIMYGKDRLTQPLLRMKNGKYDKEGEFTPITWDQAFDVMEEKFKTALKEKGPESIGMFGSGQWTIWEGYAASKLFKAGFRSNNIDPNARHCMASAVVGFMRTFGMDEPMGCYDDIEQADAFVLWGANMAEMHPILWSRITNRRLSNQNVTVAVLSTYQHRSFELADNGIIFTPQSDLVILNYIANYIIQNNAINQDFFSKHVNLRKGATDIGYGLRPTHPLEKAAKNPGSDASEPMSFEDYKAFVAEYTLEKTAEMTGVPKDQLEQLAQLYADPNKKVISYWTMGFNQHTRGVWANNLVYNLHLLTGKISQPGCGPFSLTGQPSACGTAREVGTFAHRLPADMVVTNEKHRDICEKKWNIPSGTIPAKIGLHAVAAFIGLVWQMKMANLAVAAMAPIGAVFTFIALVTGSAWGKPMWGTWWVWDARLTSELVLLFLYVGVIALWHAFDDRRLAGRAAGILVLIGVVNLPIIHYSVEWWNTLHQGSTRMQQSIDPAMRSPLRWSIFGFLLLSATLTLMRMRNLILLMEKRRPWVSELILKRGRK